MNIITILCIPETHLWTPCFECIYLNYSRKLQVPWEQQLYFLFLLSSLQCLEQCWINTKWLACQGTLCFIFLKWWVFSMNPSIFNRNVVCILQHPKIRGLYLYKGSTQWFSITVWGLSSNEFQSQLQDLNLHVSKEGLKGTGKTVELSWELS